MHRSGSTRTPTRKPERLMTGSAADLPMGCHNKSVTRLKFRNPAHKPNTAVWYVNLQRWFSGKKKLERYKL